MVTLPMATGKSVMIAASAPRERADKMNVHCPALGHKPCHRPRCSGTRCERWEAKDKGISFVEDDFQIVVLAADELAELRKWARMDSAKLPEAVAAMVRSFVAAEKDALSAQARVQIDRQTAELESRVDVAIQAWKRFGEQLQQRVIDVEARERLLEAKASALEVALKSFEVRVSRHSEHLSRLESKLKALR